MSVFVRGAAMATVQRGTARALTWQDCVRTAREALGSAGTSPTEIGTLVVGTMMASRILSQQQLAAKLATELGIQGTTLTIDAACGSGGAAIHMGTRIVRTDAKPVLVVGVEHMRWQNTAWVTEALARASDWETEGALGETFVSLNGTLMEAYLERYGGTSDDLNHAPRIAHTNAATNPHALYRRGWDGMAYTESKRIHPHFRLFDASAICNGSAALCLSPTGQVGVHPRITGSAASTDALALSKRSDPLSLDAVRRSTRDCLDEADRTHDEIDFAEPHDAYSIMTAATLEAAGFVPNGMFSKWGERGHFQDVLPICTFGGLKARGHPVGASGVYQAVEAVKQCTHAAPPFIQVLNARVGLTQSIGGAGTAVYTHIFEL